MADLRQDLAELIARTCGDAVPAERLEALAVGILDLVERHRVAPAAEDDTQQAVISVLGKERPGIVAGVSRILADRKVSIHDINQTLVKGKFAMVIVADMAGAACDLHGLREALRTEDERLGVAVFCQEASLLSHMYRIGQ